MHGVGDQTLYLPQIVPAPNVPSCPTKALFQLHCVSVSGAKKRKARSVSRWNNVIRHLQMDYEADFEKLECETCAVAKVKEKDVVHPCKEEAFLQVEMHSREFCCRVDLCV